MDPPSSFGPPLLLLSYSSRADIGKQCCPENNELSPLLYEFDSEPERLAYASTSYNMPLGTRVHREKRQLGRLEWTGSYCTLCMLAGKPRTFGWLMRLRQRPESQTLDASSRFQLNRDQGGDCSFAQSITASRSPCMPFHEQQMPRSAGDRMARCRWSLSRTILRTAPHPRCCARVRRVYESHMAPELLLGCLNKARDSYQWQSD